MAEVVSERPTFQQAFAADTPVAESLPADPSTETPAAEPSAPAATEQAVSEAPAEVTPAEGPIPYPRFKEVNEAKKSLEAKLEQLKWAESVDRAHIEEASKIGQLYQQDRAGFIRQVLSEALTDPQMAQLVRSEAGRVLASRSQAAPQPQVDLSPDIPVMDNQGNVVAHAYSADRMKQVLKAELDAYVAREFTPIKTEYEQRKAQEQAEKVRHEIDTWAMDTVTEAREVFPLFKEHEEEIGKVFNAMPRNGDDARNLRKAWHQVIGHKLALADQVKAQTLDELKTKAAASTVNPASAAVSTPRKVTSLLDPSLTW